MKKFTIQQIRKKLHENGCVLLEEKYVNNQTKMKYICSCGNISYTRFSDFQAGKRCKLCKRNKLRNKFSLSYDYVAKFFQDQGCQLLDQTYVNARTKLNYICSCGNESTIVFDSFKSGNRCRECGNKKSGTRQTFSQEYIEEYFKKFDCELLDPYVKATSKVHYRCKCGNIEYKSYTDFKDQQKCNKCSLKERSGSNHYMWQQNREQFELNSKFRQRTYKLVKMVLNATGKVKNKKTTELLGYDYKVLQEHIVTHPNWKFVQNLDWHIDHIFPIKAFLDYKLYDLALVNCLENLRPVTKEENLAKNAKYDKIEFETWLKKKGVQYGK